jgi:hypothetical protein
MNRLFGVCGSIAIVVLASAAVSPAAPPQFGVALAPENAAARRERIIRNFDYEAVKQLEPVLRIEVRFMTKICGPTPQQVEQLKQDRPKQLAEIAQELRARDFNLDDPWEKLHHVARRVVQEKVAAWVRANLSPAEAARYEAETQKRCANIHEVCARSLVADLDRLLFLSHQQRDKLERELAAHWDDKWTSTFVIGSCPKIPDELLVSYLDSQQQARWKNLPKVDSRSWGLEYDVFLGIRPQLDDKH